ncbi:hypothetical protein HKX48_000174 [Thoreauomyces humboldtii]|nr:hypothetical protein HKX48_000174 [Thoreauomyces humboldtii]
MKISNKMLDGLIKQIFDHITKRRAKGSLLHPMPASKFDFQDPVEVWRFALQNETDNSRAIMELFRQAREEADFTTENFMQWYVSEQLEEEAAVSDILENAKRVMATSGLYVQFDQQITSKPH